MNYSFHPEAEEELIKAIDFYEEQERELGLDFSMEVYQTIQRVIANPKSWTKISKKSGESCYSDTRSAFFIILIQKGKRFSLYQ